VEEYPETQDEWLDLWEDVIKNACGNARWLNSYYDPADDKLYCVWEAESEDQITACFGEVNTSMAPIQEIREVAFFDIEALAASLNS
jgi:hypothetical protein